MWPAGDQSDTGGAAPRARRARRGQRALRVEEYEGQRVLIQDGVILSVAVPAGDPSFGYWTAMLPRGRRATRCCSGSGRGRWPI